MKESKSLEEDKLERKIQEKIEADKALRDQLTLGPDLLVQRKSSEESIDKKIEKVELTNGETLDLRALRSYIAERIQVYEKKFDQEYYREIFRLNAWPIPKNGIISRKPSIVGRYTNDIIYGRFPKEVLPRIESQNRFDEMGKRLYKHFQFLTPEGTVRLEQYIKDSITIMKKCEHWDEFVAEHAKAFGHPFQTSLFD